MKWFSLILLACMIPTCFAEMLVQENFEGAIFPPPGWTTGNISILDGGAYWRQYYESDKHFADGEASCLWNPPYYSWGKAWLNTPSFNLTMGDTLILEFDTYVSMFCFDPSIKIILYGSKVEWQTTNSLWEQYIWKHYTYIIPITRSDLYFLQFEIDPRNVSYQHNTRYVDNVVAARKPSNNNVNMVPTTLGRIKSSYK